MKKLFLLFLFVLMSFYSLFAAATVKDFFGKVKVKYDGDTKWSRVSMGMELPANATVSTGFNSQIVLDLGNATLDVLPLTRMTINEITESKNTINTTLFLQGGKIKADVKRLEGKVNDFKIKSPVATASVRGTAFEFSGNKLKVIRGEVAFSPARKKKSDITTVESDSDKEDAETKDVVAVSVKAGGVTQMASAAGIPIKPKAMAKKLRSINASTKPEIIRDKKAIIVDAVEKGLEAPVPSAVQAALEETTRITITFKPIEE